MIISQELSIVKDIGGDGVPRGKIDEQMWQVKLIDDEKPGEPMEMQLGDMLGLIKVSFKTSLNFADRLPPDLKAQIKIQMKQDLENF